MGREIGNGRVVDGRVISNIMTFDVVASKRGNIRDGRMTFGVMVSSAMTCDMVTYKEEI